MLIDIIEEAEVQIVVQNWKTLIKTNDYLLTLDTTLEDGKVLLNFNVHFEVTNAAQASEFLSKENSFLNIKDKILSMANRLDNLGE